MPKCDRCSFFSTYAMGGYDCAQCAEFFCGECCESRGYKTRLGRCGGRSEYFCKSCIEMLLRNRLK